MCSLQPKKVHIMFKYLYVWDNGLHLEENVDERLLVAAKQRQNVRYPRVWKIELNPATKQMGGKWK